MKAFVKETASERANQDGYAWVARPCDSIYARYEELMEDDIGDYRLSLKVGPPGPRLTHASTPSILIRNRITDVELRSVRFHVL